MTQWTLPAVEFAPADAKGTTILVADAGRKKVGPEVEALLKAGQRVIAVDPFYFGESRIRTHDYLYALLFAAVGDRPLGLQASQLTAVSRWAHERHSKGSVTLKAVGPRSGLFALIAAALEPEAISDVEVTGAMNSLKEVIENNGSVDKTPELFCFGLLEHFDIPQLKAMAVCTPDRSHWRSRGSRYAAPPELGKMRTLHHLQACRPYGIWPGGSFDVSGWRFR